MGVARALYDELMQSKIRATNQNLRVFVDQICLKDRERWDQGFMDGLCASWIFVPVVSIGSVSPVAMLNADDNQRNDLCDNVLFEWIAGLELHSRGMIKALMPVIVGDKSGKPFNFGLTKTLSLICCQ